MSDESTQKPPEDQVARAKRLREQIEGLKSGRPPATKGPHKPSLREQIDRASQKQKQK